MKRSRIGYLAAAFLVIGLGLMSRRFGSWLPDFVARYAGDTLWAMMVFLGMAVLWPRLSTRKLAAIAWGFSVGIEISQLYHADWLDAVRRTRLGGLVLGQGFLWTDLVCYTAGILLLTGFEHFTQVSRDRAGSDDESFRVPLP
jgi:hypothetical protein